MFEFNGTSLINESSSLYKEIEFWISRHIIESHWEFSTHHFEIDEQEKSPFEIIITPSLSKTEDPFEVTTRCNICGEQQIWKRQERRTID